MVKSEEIFGTTKYLTLWSRCHINQCRYNQVQLYILLSRPSSSKHLHFFEFYNQNHASICPPHGTCPTYLNTLQLIALTMSGEKHTSKLLTQFLTAAYYFLLIRQKSLASI